LSVIEARRGAGLIMKVLYESWLVTTFFQEVKKSEGKVKCKQVYGWNRHCCSQGRGSYGKWITWITSALYRKSIEFTITSTEVRVWSKLWRPPSNLIASRLKY